MSEYARKLPIEEAAKYKTEMPGSTETMIAASIAISLKRIADQFGDSKDGLPDFKWHLSEIISVMRQRG